MITVLPATDNEYDGQLVHTAEPVTDLNFPASQVVQAPAPFAPVVPAGHSQLRSLVAPVVGVLFELPHGVQVAGPVTLLCDPTAHGWQLVAAPV